MSEQKEASEIKDPNAGLSVSGSQLLVLAYLDVLPSELPGDWKDEKSDRSRRRLREKTLPPIQTMVLEGNALAAKLALGKVVGRNPQLRTPVEEITTALGADVAIKEVIGGNPRSPMSSFIRTLEGKPLGSISSETRTLFLTDLGTSVVVYPAQNRFLVRVFLEKHEDDFEIELPLDRQHPVCVDAREIFGGIGEEARLSKTEVFGALRERYTNIYTHDRAPESLLYILNDGYYGVPFETGIVTTHRGIFVAKSDLKEERGSTTEKADWPKYSKEPRSTGPIAIISDHVGERIVGPIHGWPVIDGGVDIQDPDLMGIWVTPTYRGHLLHWISTWDEIKRQQTFGQRKPEALFLSSAEDVARL